MKPISLAVAAFVSAVTFPSPAQSAPDLYDIVIYGGTSAGISAAAQEVQCYFTLKVNLNACTFRKIIWKMRKH